MTTVAETVSATAVGVQTNGRLEHAKRFYRPELDVLRFFAFLGVFIFHSAPRTMDFYNAAGYPHWLSGLLIPTFGAGAYGVDLFFALSAYLITSLLLRERAATGALDLRGFYLRRILRIWPLYLAFVAFAAVFALLVPGQHLPMKYVVGYSLLAGNWIYVFYGLPASFAVPLWTVSIEEQFYLAWPLALRKASVRAMAIIAAGILVAANAWRVWLAVSAAPAERIEYNTFTRLDPIALGILIALFGHKLPQFYATAAAWRCYRRSGHVDCCVRVHSYQSYIEVHHMADGRGTSIHGAGQRGGFAVSARGATWVLSQSDSALSGKDFLRALCAT